jgi:hypothetical protein
MRVGEILLQHGWVAANNLQRALSEQRHAGKRLCSMMIGRGLLDADHAARALGEQHGVAAIQQRHLENRDRTLIPLLPGALARSIFALPVGRTREGGLIVCVRDPRSELLAVLKQSIPAEREIVMAVGPASQLERLIDHAYERDATNDEYEVDMTTGPIDLTHLSLVDLDDHRVAKDPSQSSPLMRPITIPPVIARTTPSSGITAAGPAPVSIDDALTRIAAATTRDAATDLAMRYAHTRWVAALLVAIREGAALGHRGHGTQLSPDAVQAVSFPLTAPSLIKTAHDTRRLASEIPAGAGAIQERLGRLLGQPRAPHAAPVAIAGRVACVLVVGDPTGAGDSGRDAERLATALGEAYGRVLRDKKA